MPASDTRPAETMKAAALHFGPDQIDAARFALTASRVPADDPQAVAVAVNLLHALEERGLLRRRSR